MIQDIQEYVWERDEEFMESRRDMTLEELLHGDVACSIDDLKNFDEVLREEFLTELFDDDEFLETKIISHYKKDDGTRIFGLQKYASCEFCKVYAGTITRQFALIVNAKTKSTSLEICVCNEIDMEMLRYSKYVGKTIRYLKETMLKDFYCIRQ